MSRIRYFFSGETQTRIKFLHQKGIYLSFSKAKVSPFSRYVSKSKSIELLVLVPLSNTVSNQNGRRDCKFVITYILNVEEKALRTNANSPT